MIQYFFPPDISCSKTNAHLQMFADYEELNRNRITMSFLSKRTPWGHYWALLDIELGSRSESGLSRYTGHMAT